MIEPPESNLLTKVLSVKFKQDAQVLIEVKVFTNKSFLSCTSPLPFRYLPKDLINILPLGCTS